MNIDNETKNIITITNDGSGASKFSTREFSLSGDKLRRLSEHISAENFRLGTSTADYSSVYHVAGDPTLLIILNGVFRLQLRNGDHHDFATGEMFIAQDYLAAGVQFDDSLHGHRAEVVGEKPAFVLHLKLEKRYA